MMDYQKLQTLLGLGEEVVVVDVGASHSRDVPPYHGLLEAGAARLIGFEPNEAAYERLLAKGVPHATYLPYAVGNGRKTDYHATRAVGLSSTLKLSSWVGDYFGPWWQKQLRSVETHAFDTKKLDDMSEISRMDFLKIDIQGGELTVFRHAKRLLADALMVQTEVALMPFYDKQPSYSDIDRELSKHGLVSYSFAPVNRIKLHSGFRKTHALKAKGSQVLDLDMIYVRDPRTMTDWETESVKRMILLAIGVLGAYDLAYKCVDVLIERGALDESAAARFFKAA